MRMPEDSELASHQTTLHQMQAMMNQGSNSTSINRAGQQSNDGIKRVSNRTPQSFIGTEKMTSAANTQATGVSSNIRDQRSSTNKTEAIKSSINGSTSIQTQGANANITELHKNAMHIKKLNFTGGRQM